MSPDELKHILDDAIAGEGVSHFGWTRLATPLSIEMYRAWLNEGLHGSMTYLEDHRADKEDPSRRFPTLKTVLAFAFPYRPHPRGAEDFPLSSLRVASYARGNDYHHWLRDRLKRIAARLSTAMPSVSFEAHTDSTPLLERDYARQAALGWVGKNTCVIHPKHGSFFLLGEILCSESFETPLAPLPDFCGTCNRCLEVCPTGALIEPRKLDARKCISYLTIESREDAPEELRRRIGDWLFGCDLCQTVCPWNGKPFQPSEGEKQAQYPLSADAADPHASRENLVRELTWIFRSTGKQLEKAFERTAMSRVSAIILKRNALVVAANRRLHELRPEIELLTTHERLGDHARWCLKEWDS